MPMSDGYEKQTVDRRRIEETRAQMTTPESFALIAGMFGGLLLLGLAGVGVRLAELRSSMGGRPESKPSSISC